MARTRARGRTWALGTLDRDGLYLLWFDVETWRWEIERQEHEHEPRHLTVVETQYPPAISP